MKRKFEIKPFETVSELADYLGIKRQTVYARLASGWKVSDVISKKKQANGWIEYAKIRQKDKDVNNLQ